MAATILHLHIPRTGGTSIYHHVKRVIGDRACMFSNSAETVEQALREGRDLALVSGHFFWGMHTLFTRHIYLVILREPEARVASIYDYVRGNPRHRLHGEYRRTPLAEVMARPSAARTQMCNGQVRQLCGPDRVGKEIGEADYRLAWENLCRPDLVVTFTDRINEGLAELSARTGIDLKPQVEPINASRKNAVTEHASRMVRGGNQWDIRLYAQARERFTG